MSSIRDTLDSYIVPFQRKLGPIPLDGLVVTALTYFLSPNDTRIRNAVLVGSAHFLLHESVVHAENRVQLVDVVQSPMVPDVIAPPPNPSHRFSIMPVSSTYSNM